MLKRFFNWILKLFKRDTYGITPAFIERKNANTKTPPVVKKDMPKKMVVPRWGKPCAECGNPMMVSVGQIALTHKECRKAYRRRVKN